jgi:hypothetical protein
LAGRGEQIEFCFEIFEVQSEIENTDVEVGLLRQSACRAKACGADRGSTRRAQSEAAKKISRPRSFRQRASVRLTGDRHRSNPLI